MEPLEVKRAFELGQGSIFVLWMNNLSTSSIGLAKVSPAAFWCQRAEFPHCYSYTAISSLFLDSIFFFFFLQSLYEEERITFLF